MLPLRGIRRPLVAAVLVACGACGGAPPLGRASEGPPGERAHEGPARDSLAAVIRSVRAGEESARLAEAVAAAARIPPGDLGNDLRDAMTQALGLSIMAEMTRIQDSVLTSVGPVLEGALARAWSQAELAAVIREIPSRTDEVTTRDLVAARLASRLGAGEASEELLAAMAEALASIAVYSVGDSGPKVGFRDEVAVAWARQHSPDDLAGFIRSIASGIEGPEQAAAVDVVEPFGFRLRHRRGPPAWADSTGMVTHPGMRSALAEALAYMNEVGSRRTREIERMEAIGDHAARDSLWALEYGAPSRWGGRVHIHKKLAWAVRRVGDPAMLELLVRSLHAGLRPSSGVSLAAFGEAAVPHLLAALGDTAASGAWVSWHLQDLAWIAKQQELAAETREALAAVLHGVFSGETLRAGRIGDPGIAVLAAIDLAYALGDSAALQRVRDFAAGPAEMVRAGLSARTANDLVLTVRSRIGWRPAPMAQAEIAAALRTVPLSAWPAASHLDAAQLASKIDPELVSGPLREAMSEAWDYTRHHWEWERVRNLLARPLSPAYDSVSALAAIRAIPAGEYGPEQLHAASALLRGDAGEEMRHAGIAALEHLNEAAVDTESRFDYDSPFHRLHRRIFDAVMAQLDDPDPRSISALVRSGFGLYRCNTQIVYGSGDGRKEGVVVARAILAAMAEPGAPPARVSAGLSDLATLLIGNNNLTRDIPNELVEEITAAPHGYLDGTSMEAYAATGPNDRFRVAMSAIGLAAVADDLEQVALVERIATDPEAVAALGLTDPNDEESIRRYARRILAARPILWPGEC